jgi:endonuclease V-like protein UPF0215 family
MAGDVRFRSIKSEIRVLGLANFVPDPNNRERLIAVGVVYRGRLWFDGVMWTSIRYSERDATERIATMITSSPHHKQLRVIVMERRTARDSHSINLGDLFKLTGLPVIMLMKETNREGVTGRILTAGISKDDATKIIEVNSAVRATPEALRVATMIAKRLTQAHIE